MVTAAMSQKTFQNLLPSYAVLYIRPLLFLRLLPAPVLSLWRRVPASPLLPEAYFHLPFPHCCCRFHLKNRLPGNLLTVYTLSSWRDRCPVTQCVFFGFGFPVIDRAGIEPAVQTAPPATPARFPVRLYPFLCFICTVRVSAPLQFIVDGCAVHSDSVRDLHHPDALCGHPFNFSAVLIVQSSVSFPQCFLTSFSK